MSLDFDYGINVNNRFLDLIDHDEDPDEFVARKTQAEEKSKKSSKETKAATNASAKKSANKTTPTAAAAATTTTTTTTKSAASTTTKANKENVTEKSANTEQRRPQSSVLGDHNNQAARADTGRGGRGASRRGAYSAGQNRPPYEGGNRGGGQNRPRFNKFEGQQPSGFDQVDNNWTNEPVSDNQTFGGYRGRGRGRGGPRRGNFEGGRGGGRGRGRGGRGYFTHRPAGDGSYGQEQPIQETPVTQSINEPSFDNTHPEAVAPPAQDLGIDVVPQERPFEFDNTRRGRGHYRARVFRNSRNFAGDRQHQDEGDQDNYRRNRRQHDRQPRTFVSGVKPIEKKDGAGAHNWGPVVDNPEEIPLPDDTTEATDQTAAAATAAPVKDWAQQVEEAEQQMTLDEYKKKLEAKKQAQQEKIPQFNRRTANEGEDPKKWQKFDHKYQKKESDEESGDEDAEESGEEEHEDDQNADEEHGTGKKKIITIPLQFKPIDLSRGPGDARGGQRRRGGFYRDRPYRDDQPRSKSPNQQQAPVSQPAGDYQNPEQQQRPYQRGSRQGSGRGEYRRTYVNSARDSRGGYRSHAERNTPDFASADDFPTLKEQTTTKK